MVMTGPRENMEALQPSHPHHLFISVHLTLFLEMSLNHFPDDDANQLPEKDDIAHPSQSWLSSNLGGVRIRKYFHFKDH